MASNEPGNDTAAGRAFQVGDRVRWHGAVQFHPDSQWHEGVVERIKSGGWLRLQDDETRGDASVHESELIFLSRATPASAQPAPERNSFAMTMPCWFGKHAECDGTLREGTLATPDVVSSPCACECHPTGQPATPALAGYSSDDALYECPNLDCEMVAVTPLVRTSDGALCCPECKTELVAEPATPAPAPAQTVDEGEQYDGEYVTEPQTREKMRVPQVCRDCAWDDLAPYTVQGDFLPINGWRICTRCNAINGPYPLDRMCIACAGTGRVEGSLCAYCRGTGIDPTPARRLMTDQEAANAAVPHAEPDVDDMPYPDGAWHTSDDDDPDGDEDWDDGQDDDDDPDDADVDFDDWQRTPPEPATPAPAATPPALDTHTLDLPVMVRCTACDGSGTERHGEGHLPCPYCAGLGYSDMHIRLSDEAVDRLAGELVKRISKRLDPHIHPLRNARY